jgi:SH3-like domain-containing protein
MGRWKVNSDKWWIVLIVWGALTVLQWPSLAMAAERLSVSAPNANIRSGPGDKYEVVWKAGQYYPIEVTERSGKWILFKDYEGDEGWVHESLVGTTPTVITKKDVCNLRSGPKGSDPMIGTVGAGIPFKVLEKKNGWIHVEHADGDKGWIHESLVW